MKVWSLPGLQSVSTWEDLRRFSTQALTNFSQILSKGIGFQDNINCQIVEFTATGGVEATVPHNLNVIPIGYIVIDCNNYEVLKRGDTPWTTSNIYLIAQNSTVYKIIILGS